MDNTKELLECLKPVQSSMFSKAGYSPDYWTLVFVFKSTGEVKAYRNVAPEVADAALSAKSLGSWWNQNIRNKPEWEGEIIGAEPPEPGTKAAKADKPAESLSVIDSDIRLVEPGWNGKTIDPLPSEGIRAEDMGLQPTTWPTYGGIDRSQTTIPVPQPGVVFQGVQGISSDHPGFGVKAFDPETGHWPSDAVSEDGTVKEEAVASIVRQPVGEILPAWTAPETAAEALELLSERESEIRSIVAQNSERSKAALACQVRDLATHTEAGKTLTELVNVKDVTFKLLDPFRVVLYDAYKFAQDKSKSAIEPIDTAITHIKRQMGAWEAEQERQRQARVAEERRRADEAARELQRKQAEQLTLAEVADALDTGDTAKAEELLAHPIEVPLPYVAPAVVEPTYLAPAGQSTRANWKIDEDYIDLVAFLRAVKDGKLELEVAARFILPNIPALNKQAKSLESTFSIPGFRAKNEPVRSVRRGK